MARCSTGRSKPAWANRTWSREITIDSTLAHICDADLPAALDVLADGQLGTGLVETPVPLDQLGPSLDRLSSGHLEGKVLIDPSI
ncbi:hypothetical protein [Mycobacterium sp.]|uniref:hypothetical protein n=1 Tax=Mycobacterium sp. TaxID=1785 RepID=UPI002BB85AC7|nr:hypothetical protein [Mycobacterium sp.]HTQ20320.1 hypothetical protein [Mycobacterium sp.]